MPTEQEVFRHLPLAQQLALLWDKGTLLATRWQGGDVVEVFQLTDGAFCEVYCQGQSDTLRHLHYFISSE